MTVIDERILEEFFYHGTENIPELMQGIVYFATHEMHELYDSLDKQYDTPNDIQLSQIREIAYKLGLQYHRFIWQNKKTSKLIDFKTEDGLDEVNKMIDRTIDTAINENYLIEYGVGYYYSREKEREFSVTYIKEHTKRKHWTIEIAEQLKQLSIKEKEDPIEYYRHWIITRLRNAQSRGENTDNSEIELLENVKMQLDEKIEKMKEDKEDKEENKSK